MFEPKLVLKVPGNLKIQFFHFLKIFCRSKYQLELWQKFFFAKEIYTMREFHLHFHRGAVQPLLNQSLRAAG